MEDSQPSFTQSVYDAVWPARWSDRKALLLLLSLSLAFRLGVLWMTTIPARDGIGFIEYALELEQRDWRHVIRDAYHHPGYPLSILLVSYPVRFVLGGTDCISMQLSAQCAGALAGWLLVVPMFYLGKLLYGRGVAFWGALLFQCLPESSEILSNAISDPLFFLLFTTALYFGVRAMAGASLRPFAWCGVFSGLAYWVRPEGLLIVLVTGLVLLVRQFIKSRRCRWNRFLLCCGSLVVAASVVASPYYLITGAVTNKPSVRLLWKRLYDQWSHRVQLAQPSSMIDGPIFAAYINTNRPLTERMLSAGKAWCGEFAHAYQYLGWLPALIGIWWCRDRYRRNFGSWVILVVFLVQSFVIWLLAVVIGYVSVRYILLLVICTIFQAVAVTFQVPFRLHRWRQRRRRQSDHPSAIVNSQQCFSNSAVWAVALVSVMVAVAAPRSFKSSHSHRQGHYRAGLWLADHSTPADLIIDNHGWAYYYSGRCFQRASAASPTGTNRHFVVIGRSGERRPDSYPGRFVELQVQQQGGRIVFQWPESSPADRARVVIYEVAGAKN